MNNMQERKTWASRFWKAPSLGSSPSLCKLCSNLAPQGSQPSLRLQISVQSLMRIKKASGCRYCILLRRIIEHFDAAPVMNSEYLHIESDLSGALLLSLDGMDAHWRVWYILMKPPSWSRPLQKPRQCKLICPRKCSSIVAHTRRGCCHLRSLGITRVLGFHQGLYSEMRRWIIDDTLTMPAAACQ